MCIRDRPLTEAVQNLDLTGYNALTGTHAIVTMDANTGAVKTGAVEVSLYVPNLVDNLANVQVLFYDNATGQWQLIPALKVDPVTKTVAVNVPGSGTLSLIHISVQSDACPDKSHNSQCRDPDSNAVNGSSMVSQPTHASAFSYFSYFPYFPYLP